MAHLVESRLQTLLWYLPLILLLSAIIGVPMMVWDDKGLPRYRSLQKELRQLRQANAEIQSEIDSLRVEVQGLKSDPDAIEAIARDELNMVRDGEVVFQF